MNMKRVSMGGLVVTLLCLGVVRAEDIPAPKEGGSGPLFPAPLAEPTHDSAGPATPEGPAPLGVATSSTWIDYQRCLGCCGPVGGNGPIGYEVYLRNGVDFPIGGNPFGASHLGVGWDVTGGARTLFFDAPMDKAWTVDLSITNIFNTSTDSSTKYQLFNLVAGPNLNPIPEVDGIVKNLNRTYVNVAGGREWYLWGSADSCQEAMNLRVGADLGGRWGTERVTFTNFRHLTDINAGVFVALHSDLEIPCGCCIFQAGLRWEYGYTWSDVLQHQNNSDIEDMNLLLTAGVRF